MVRIQPPLNFNDLICIHGSQVAVSSYQNSQNRKNGTGYSLRASSQDYTPGDMIPKPPPLTDFTERSIESQEEADYLHHAACAQQNACYIEIRQADDRIKAAILQRQLAEQRLMQAD
ncbi:hypothetical protein BD779DRAFT_1481168 [Infundibulicybe gibba]|nr:hypothetical protein BD779DRAFT_1481168 [Infundibulicybe gibba]